MAKRLVAKKSASKTTSARKSKPKSSPGKKVQMKASKPTVKKTKLHLAKGQPKPKTGLLWKLLEQKQKSLENMENKHPFAHAETGSAGMSGHGQRGFGRFNGPRRRAA